MEEVSELSERELGRKKMIIINSTENHDIGNKTNVQRMKWEKVCDCL